MSETLELPQDYGHLLAFDGINGTGKTTQIGWVASRLTDIGLDVFVTHIHGDTPIGEKLSSVSKSPTPRRAITDLFLSRTMHAELIPELHERRARGQTILLDRSPLSITAYQSFGDRLPLEISRPHVDEAMTLFNPDLIVIFDAAVGVARLRARKASQGKGDYFENKGDAYFERVRRGYLDEAARYAPKYDTTVINTERPAHEVRASTMRYVLSSLLSSDLR